jgi:hypothetical protein
MPGNPQQVPSMRVSPISVMLWVVAFAAAGASLSWWQARRSALPPVEDPSWIPLPASGMDASRPGLRELLVSRYDGANDLAATCGMYDDGAERERYRIRISRNAWEDFREIEIVPRGEWLEIAIRDGFPPPLPEPPRDGTSRREYDPIHPATHVRIRRRDAEPIRRAWDSAGLWHAEQEHLPGCMDGRAVTLEACIVGRYAIRRRNCDAGADVPTQRLWEAITAAFPKPERAYYRER